jgi:hypothetical protein
MTKNIFSGSYKSSDVVFLLKEISGLITERDNEYRENAIQSGIHYSEMLPIEYHPTQEYMKIFFETLEDNKLKIATLVGLLSNKIVESRGKEIILVSLARAGTPIGILIKRYLKYKWSLDVPHYSISIIRDRGIDENALIHILKKHSSEKLQFIDGWTGKGVIQDTLFEACSDFNSRFDTSLNSKLAVISDPAYCTSLFGTREDFLIPSACLNSTVSGLISRTVYNRNIIHEKDYHGVKYYKEYESMDVSNYFIDSVSKEFKNTPERYTAEALDAVNEAVALPYKGIVDIENIKKICHIDNINLIKPGVGETTRVLLRRIPWKIYIDSFENQNLRHIIILARDRNVPLEVYKDMSYSCCGIIKPKGLGDI